MFKRVRNIYTRMITLFRNNHIQKIENIDYEKIISLMQEKGIYDEFKKEIENFEQIDELMNNKTNLHGTNHIVRVLFNCYAIMALENIGVDDKKIIVEAVKLHDIGRIGDGEDREHGEKGAIKAKQIMERKGFSQDEIDKICFIIKEHCLSKKQNEKDIENLPQEKQKEYSFLLNVLKDADKLDRVRLGDLDPKRLSLENSKRLVEVAKDIFYNNKYYYKKKLKVYPFNEQEAIKMLERIKNTVSDTNIDMEEIKNNFSTYKSIVEQGKIDWLKIKSDIPFNNFLEIIDNVSKEEMEYLQMNNLAGRKCIVNAIYDMRLNKFMQLKSDKKLDCFMDIHNYKRLIESMTDEEKNLIIEFTNNDLYKEVIPSFYIYYYLIKNFTKEEIDIVLQACKDQLDYYNDRTSDNDSGYKWSKQLFVVPIQYKIALVKKIGSEKLKELKEKTNVPLNIIMASIWDLNLFLDEKETKGEDIEKIIKNYNKYKLDVLTEKDADGRQKMISMLLSLPDDIGPEYEEIIKECLIGRFSKLNINSFEKMKNYQKICDEKILQEFEENDNIQEIKNLIFQTKIKDLNGLKRDIYFYGKYNPEDARQNEVYNYFMSIFKCENKEELLDSYMKIDNLSQEFYFDELLNELKDSLSSTSKKDIVSKMGEMQEKVKHTEGKTIEGKKVIDLTGTKFNLLISVIGSEGSAYLLEYYNKIIDSSYNNRKKKKKIKNGIKKRVRKRYKIDPLKNKQRCVSSIDEDFLGHVQSTKNMENKRQTENKLILAYFPKNTTDIYWMGNYDLMTIYDKERNDPTRKRIPHKDNLNNICNLKLEDLNAITVGDDNEIVIDSYPGAVMCFDHISDVSYKTSKRYNIPILYIDSKEQFRIMKQRLYKYYDEVQQNILENTEIGEDVFNKAFHLFEQNNNIIHRAFKMANSFTYLDDDEYPKEELIEIFDRMKLLVKESLNKCNKRQKQQIQDFMKKEADPANLRYKRYDNYIDFYELIGLVSNRESAEQQDRGVK
ncbi:MAG: HD domain-containing protein [Clostridia bacterium]|nr:HD domain-containing protein [Clostridia bacterium]